VPIGAAVFLTVPVDMSFLSFANKKNDRARISRLKLSVVYKCTHCRLPKLTRAPVHSTASSGSCFSAARQGAPMAISGHCDTVKCEIRRHASFAKESKKSRKPAYCFYTNSANCAGTTDRETARNWAIRTVEQREAHEADCHTLAILRPVRRSWQVQLSVRIWEPYWPSAITLF
jgi:hypothetical protein